MYQSIQSLIYTTVPTKGRGLSSCPTDIFTVIGSWAAAIFQITSAMVGCVMVHWTSSHTNQEGPLWTSNPNKKVMDLHDEIMRWKKLSTLLALCEGNPPVTGGSPHKGPVMQSSGIFFVPSLNKLLNKQLSYQQVTSDMRYHDAHMSTLQ